MVGNLGQPIAYGRTAEIYAWHAGQVLKLFYEWFGLENIENEARVSRAVHATGLPTPAVGEIVRVNQRYGLEYERVVGRSMWKEFQRKPWNIFRYSQRCVQLQVGIHTIPLVADLPSQRKLLESNILHARALPAQLRSKALAALTSLPDGDQLCHGDYWPGNMMLTAKGEIIIDWFRASRGNPLADLARTTNLFLGYTGTRQIERPFLTSGSSKMSRTKNSFLQVILRLFYPAYIDHYFKLSPGSREEYLRWLPVVAAARLADNIPELEQMLLAQVQENL